MNGSAFRIWHINLFAKKVLHVPLFPAFLLHIVCAYKDRMGISTEKHATNKGFRGYNFYALAPLQNLTKLTDSPEFSPKCCQPLTRNVCKYLLLFSVVFKYSSVVKNWLKTFGFPNKISTTHGRK